MPALLNILVAALAVTVTPPKKTLDGILAADAQTFRGEYYVILSVDLPPK